MTDHTARLTAADQINTALLATIKETRARNAALAAALTVVYDSMERARPDEWAMEWLGDVWSTLPLEVRATAGDQDAADELPAPSAAGPAAPTDTDPTGLRQRIAETLTAKAYECDGKCGLSERECYDAHPITFSAMCNGTTHIDAPVTAIADAVLAVLPAPADRATVLRETADRFERDPHTIQMFGHQVAALLRRMADETATTQTATHPCNAATMHRLGNLATDHGPHLWVVQPDMQPVHCPGTRKPPMDPVHILGIEADAAQDGGEQ